MKVTVRFYDDVPVPVRPTLSHCARAVLLAGLLAIAIYGAALFVALGR